MHTQQTQVPEPCIALNLDIEVELSCLLLTRASRKFSKQGDNCQELQQPPLATLGEMWVL